ncbi:MAG: acyl--CoA ligase [Oscillospiraceae bacterium]|nr:acyl--CoA ligase [Candidatus Ruminococcus equi]
MEAEKKLTGYPSIDKPWLKYYTKEAINAPLPECTIYEYLWYNNKDHLDDVALIYFGKKITYGELFENIDKTARAFSAVGVKSGDVVSLVMLNTPETICSIYAISKIGAITNIIEPRTNAELIIKRINDTNSKALLVHDVFFTKINASIVCKNNTINVSLSCSMPAITKIGFALTTGRKIAKPNLGISWHDFIKNHDKAEITEVKYQKDTNAVIIYTGGTTGISKGAMLSNDAINNIVFHQKSSNPCMVRHDSFLDIMPPFLAYGLACGVHIPLCVGMKSILIPNFTPDKFAKLIAKYKPNHVLGVPAFWDSLSTAAEMQNFDLSFLKSAITGGDRMVAETENSINAFLKSHNSNVFVTKGYGMTEACSSVTFTNMIETNKPGSVGVPQLHNTFKVVDPETNKELKYGERGEICFFGPTMMLGYYRNSEETDKVIRIHEDGRKWIHSQDIGYIDEDGVVFIVDRIKRMIVRPDGHNVFPAQIEAVLLQHPSVEQCCVVGLKNPNGDNGRIPTAFVVLKENASDNMMEKDLDAFSKERLPERDVAMQYRFIDKLPLTPVGKVDYRELEQQAEQ